MRTQLGLVIPFLVACAAGVSSCGDSDSSPSTDGLDGGRDGGGYDNSAGLDSKPLSLDATTEDAPGIEASGPETALPVDVAVDQSMGRDSAVLGIDARPGSVDAGTADAALPDAPTPGPEVPPVFRADTGVDVGAKEASGPEATPTPDAPPLEAGTPDAKAEAPSADTMVFGMDSGADGATPDAVAMCGRINCDCTYKGTKLWGDVEIVTSFPDFKVKISNFPDLNVKETTFPYNCGEWHTVTAFGDFKVQFVDMFEDFAIAYSNFPGLP